MLRNMLRLIVLALVAITVDSDRDDDYVTYIRNDIIEPLLSGQEGMMELAEQLLDKRITDVYEYNGKLMALYDMMFNAASDGMERDIYMVISALEGKSPHLESPEGRRKAEEFVRLFMKHKNLDAVLLWNLIRQLTAPTDPEEMEYMQTTILKSIEDELGVGDDELKDVMGKVVRVKEMVTGGEIKPAPPRVQPVKRFRCVTAECNATMNQIYEFAEEKMLLPILGAHPLVLEIAKMMMKVNQSDETELGEISSDYYFFIKTLGVNGTDAMWLELACETIHTIYTKDEMVSFLATLKQVQVMGEGNFAAGVSVVLLSAQNHRYAEVAKRNMRAAVQNKESHLTENQRKVLLGVISGVPVDVEWQEVTTGVKPDNKTKVIEPKYPTC